MPVFHFDALALLYFLSLALCASVGAVLLLVAYIDCLPSAIHLLGWRLALGVIVLPVAGPLWFCHRHWDQCRKTGLQLWAALILLSIAALLLYGVGPHIAARALRLP